MGYSISDLWFDIDIEEAAAKRSVEEQKQKTAIGALQTDLNLGLPSSLLFASLLLFFSSAVSFAFLPLRLSCFVSMISFTDHLLHAYFTRKLNSNNNNKKERNKERN